MTKTQDQAAGTAADTTTIELVLVDLSSPWEFVPGTQYLGIDSTRVAAEIEKVQATIAGYRDRRPDMVAFHQPHLDQLTALYEYLAGAFGQTVTFTAHRRIASQVLTGQPVIVTECNEYSSVRSSHWPAGCFAVSLTYRLSTTGGESTITSFATEASRVGGRGHWEATPEFYMY
jgi:hypothetical protein